MKLYIIQIWLQSLNQATEKKDGAPLNFGLHPVFIEQYNNLYFLFYNVYTSLTKLKLASLKNNTLEEYSNLVQPMNTAAGLKLLAVPALVDSSF